ncbi:ribonuclease R [bacterium]|nr:ribonuclease R [bacterium]
MPKKKTDKNKIDPKSLLSLLRQRACSPRRLMKELMLPKSQRMVISNMLRQMAEEGKVIRLRGGLYGLPKQSKTLVGRLVQSKPGFAFVIPQDEKEPDLYVPGKNLKDAMPDDEVEVRVVSEIQRSRTRGQKRQAQIVRVVKRASEQIVGLYFQDRGVRLIHPEGMIRLHEFTVAATKTRKAKSGDQVVAKVTAWPQRYTPGEAEITEVLGTTNAPGVDITAIVRRYNLPDRFSKAALDQANAIAIEPVPKEIAQRLDLREQVIVTIDGADARDFDDAVSCETLANGNWRLGVHIADVAYYLDSGSCLDLEARERGTSVYLPDRVLHMLPEPLSCGVCSLVPKRDRYTVSAFMEVTPTGEVVNTEFHRSIIHSHERLTYDWVETVLTQKHCDNPAERYREELKQFHQVALALRAKRESRGSLDFDLPDPRVVLGPDGRVQTIEKREQLASHRLIEDCMIAANEAVAKYLRQQDVPSLYRIHEPPAGERMEEFQEFLEAYGYALKLGKSQEASKQFQKLMQQWEGKPEAQVLNMALLRAMKLAVYAPKNSGHFGLGSECYTHFTSPIRRYPDLIVHRRLTEHLKRRTQTGGQRNAWQSKMVIWGEQLSDLERRAEKAEREAVKRKRLEFMSNKIGEIFEGTITTVANYGFFVELQEHFVEGLVRSSELSDDYYYFEERQRFLQGTNSHRIFRTGQRVRIRMDRIEWEEQRVLFSLHEAAAQKKTAEKRNAPRMVRKSRRKRL